MLWLSCSYGTRKDLAAFEISTLWLSYHLYSSISASHTAVLCVNSSDTTCAAHGARQFSILPLLCKALENILRSFALVEHRYLADV